MRNIDKNTHHEVGNQTWVLDPRFTGEGCLPPDTPGEIISKATVMKYDTNNRMTQILNCLRVTFIFVFCICFICRVSLADEAKVVLSERMVTVDVSGKMVTQVRKVVRADDAGDAVGRVAVSFDASVDAARWVSVRRVSMRGDAFETVEDVTGRMAPLAPGPDTARAGIVSTLARVPLSGPGDAVEYVYEIERNRPLLGPHFWNVHVFSDAAPVRASVFSVSMPADRKLYYQAVNTDAAPEVVTGAAVVTYTWTLHDVPVAADEAAAPYVVVSSTPNWEDLFPWLNGVYAQSMVTNMDMRAFVNNAFFEFEHNRFELVRQLYERVSGGVVSAPLDYERRALPPDRADVVFARGSGDCKDKATLLAALLRQAHIDAYPALLNTRYAGDIEAQLPHPYYFNHAVVYVPKQPNFDTELWLDPTTPGREWYLPPTEDTGRPALVLMDEKTHFARIESR